MYYTQINDINLNIRKTRKAVISLGCSFVQGMGAINDELWHDYNWKKIDTYYKIDVTSEQKQEILRKYSNTYVHNDELFFTRMEYDNSFGHVLCNKYLEEKYTPINLGFRGCGNRATVQELSLHPEIDWQNLDKIIVVYCPSGMERFDFANDYYREHQHFTTMWPHPQNAQGPRKNLWQGYLDTIYSEKFAVLEQIFIVQNLLLWCKVHNAELIITPSFDNRYNKKFFTRQLFTSISRENYNSTSRPGQIFESNDIYEETKLTDPSWHQEIARLVDMWPWEKTLYPNNYPTFVDMCLGQEYPDSWQEEYYYNLLEKGSVNNWITRCAHPGPKGHDMFARIIFENLNQKGLI